MSAGGTAFVNSIGTGTYSVRTISTGTGRSTIRSAEHPNKAIVNRGIKARLRLFIGNLVYKRFKAKGCFLIAQPFLVNLGLGGVQGRCHFVQIGKIRRCGSFSSTAHYSV